MRRERELKKTKGRKFLKGILKENNLLENKTMGKVKKNYPGIGYQASRQEGGAD
jgi:hypothetical protein